MKELTAIDIIEDWADNDCIVHCDSIKYRLLELAEWAQEDEEDAYMQVKSLLDVLEFLNSRPSLTLSPAGEISASWEIFDHKLIIHFNGDGKTQAVLVDTL